MKSSTLYILFILICIHNPLSGNNINADIKGRVTCNGKPMQSVVVTDGYSCVETNKDGIYSMPYNSFARFVYISTPSGYLTDTKEKTIPQFYKAIQPGNGLYDFHLKPNPKDDSKHLFIAQTDVQMATDDDLGLYKKLLPDCASFIQAQPDIDVFGIDCGDIIGDNQALLPGYIEACSVLDIPIYRSIGNHDMDYNGRSHETSYRTFEQNFGPVYYSFNKGEAHYIVINNTFFIGRQYFYMGYVDEKTFNWLEQDLSFVPAGSPVFLIIHIPTQLNEESQAFDYTANHIASQTINAKALYELLKPYKTNIISGHMHYNRNIVHSNILYEHITGAVCGTWWQGDICLDGTPQGFGVYEVNGTDVEWYYKSFNQPKDYQFRVYKQGTYKDMPDDIVVNVWNWDKDWKVEWIENGANRGEMARFTGYDADAAALCARKDLKYNWISPIETDHMFRVKPQNPASEIRIKVTDRFGNVFEKELSR